MIDCTHEITFLQKESKKLLLTSYQAFVSNRRVWVFAQSSGRTELYYMVRQFSRWLIGRRKAEETPDH